MTDYEIEKQKKTELANAMTAKFKAVADILKLDIVSSEPDPEAIRYNYDRADLEMISGEGKIWLRYSADYGDKRVHVSGSYPRDIRNQYIKPYIHNEAGHWVDMPCPSVTISPDKTPEQIARDIKSRFLPLYIGYLKAVMEQIAENNDYETTTRESLIILKGEALTSHEMETRSIQLDIGTLPGETYDTRVHIKASRSSITLELDNIDTKTAESIITIIRRKAAK